MRRVHISIQLYRPLLSDAHSMNRVDGRLRLSLSLHHTHEYSQVIMSTINSPCARWARQNCGKFSITRRLSKQVIFPLDVAKPCPIHCRLHVLKRAKQFNEPSPTPVCLNENGDFGLAPFAPKLVVRYESDAPSCLISL